MDFLSKIRKYNINELSRMVYENKLILSMISMHWIMFIAPLLITLLTNDISILVMVSMFLLSILTINIVFHDCPISMFEDRYLGHTMIDTVSEDIHLNYNSTQRGEMTVQWLFMAILTVHAKIFLLLLKHCFFTFLSEE